MFGAGHKRRTRLVLWLRAWDTESFAWICTAETNGSWEQTNKTPRKPTRIPTLSVNRLMNERRVMTSSTWSAQTAVDPWVLPALWALWNCNVFNVFSQGAENVTCSGSRRPWGALYFTFPANIADNTSLTWRNKRFDLLGVFWRQVKQDRTNPPARRSNQGSRYWSISLTTLDAP